MFILLEDLLIPFKRDPAARNIIDIILSYPGVHALIAYRIVHPLQKLHIPILPRFLMHIVRLLTGIEIHPGAKIGRRFFIDHGMGVVIGETSEIGDDVTLFQGVTLGGTGVAEGKRHPTLGSDIVIGAGAKILGNIKIGDNVKIGSGSVVINNVPPNCTVIGVPGRIVKAEGKPVNPLKLEHTILPDPIMNRLNKLMSELKHVENELKQYHINSKKDGKK